MFRSFLSNARPEACDGGGIERAVDFDEDSVNNVEASDEAVADTTANPSNNDVLEPKDFEILDRKLSYSNVTEASNNDNDIISVPAPPPAVDTRTTILHGADPHDSSADASQSISSPILSVHVDDLSVSDFDDLPGSPPATTDHKTDNASDSVEAEASHETTSPLEAIPPKPSLQRQQSGHHRGKPIPSNLLETVSKEEADLDSLLRDLNLPANDPMSHDMERPPTEVVVDTSVDAANMSRQGLEGDNVSAMGGDDDTSTMEDDLLAPSLRKIAEKRAAAHNTTDHTPLAPTNEPAGTGIMDAAVTAAAVTTPMVPQLLFTPMQPRLNAAIRTTRQPTSVVRAAEPSQPLQATTAPKTNWLGLSRRCLLIGYLVAGVMSTILMLKGAFWIRDLSVKTAQQPSIVESNDMVPATHNISSTPNVSSLKSIVGHNASGDEDAAIAAASATSHKASWLESSPGFEPSRVQNSVSGFGHPIFDKKGATKGMEAHTIELADDKGILSALQQGFAELWLESQTSKHVRQDVSSETDALVAIPNLVSIEHAIGFMATIRTWWQRVRWALSTMLFAATLCLMNWIRQCLGWKQRDPSPPMPHKSRRVTFAPQHSEDIQPMPTKSRPKAIPKKEGTKLMVPDGVPSITPSVHQCSNRGIGGSLNAGELVDFLRSCRTELTKKGRPSRATGNASRDPSEYNLSSYENLSMEDLLYVAGRFGVSPTAIRNANKATRISLVVTAYEMILEGLTKPNLKKILATKKISPTGDISKNEMVKMAVEAAF